MPTGNDGRAGGIESDGFDLVAGDAGFLHRLASGRGQGAHVIFVRLGGVFRIFALAVQRIFGDRGFEQPALAVHDGDADAQSSEINSRHDGHQQAPLFPGWWYMSQPRYRVVASYTARSDTGKIGGHVMLETVFADVVQQLLHLRNFDHAGAAESIQRIVGESAFADVAAHLAGGVVGREAGKAHLLRLDHVPRRCRRYFPCPRCRR